MAPPQHIAQLIEAWQRLGDALSALEGIRAGRRGDVASADFVMEAAQAMNEAAALVAAASTLSGEVRIQPPAFQSLAAVADVSAPGLAGLDLRREASRYRGELRCELERLAELYGRREWLEVEDRLPSFSSPVAWVALRGMPTGLLIMVVGYFLSMGIGNAWHHAVLAVSGLGLLLALASPLARRLLQERIATGTD